MAREVLDGGHGEYFRLPPTGTATHSLSTPTRLLLDFSLSHFGEDGVSSLVGHDRNPVMSFGSVTVL